MGILQKLTKRKKTSETAEIVDTGGTYIARESPAINLILKIAAVVCAFVIWMYAMTVDSPTFETTFSGVPVTIENVESTGLSVISGYNSLVDITVQGKKSEINRISVSDIKASADVSEIKTSGRYTLSIAVQLPGGITLKSKSADNITVYMDKTVSAAVPVTVKLSGWMLDEGYELGDAIPNISEITVTGPTAVLDQIASAQITLSPGHIQNTVTISDTLTLVNAAGEPITNPYVKMQTSEVEVTLPVYVYRDVPLTVDYKYGLYNEENVTISISPSSIRLKGEAGAFNGLNEIKIATIDEKKTVSDTLTEPVTIPAGIINVYGIANATITIQHIGTGTKDIIINQFDIVNPNALACELQTDSITVTVRGPETLLKYVNASSLRATVDLSYLSDASGTIMVPVTLELSGALAQKVYPLGDYKVSVRVN